MRSRQKIQNKNNNYSKSIPIVDYYCCFWHTIFCICSSGIFWCQCANVPMIFNESKGKGCSFLCDAGNGHRQQKKSILCFVACASCPITHPAANHINTHTHTHTQNRTFLPSFLLADVPFPSPPTSIHQFHSSIYAHFPLLLLFHHHQQIYPIFLLQKNSSAFAFASSSS